MRGVGLFALLAVTGAAAHAAPLVRHELDVTVVPDEGRLAVRDHVTLPRDWPETSSFILHAGWHPVAEQRGVTLTPLGRASDAPVEQFRLVLPASQRDFTLRYQGTLARPRDRTIAGAPGIIGREGVLLDSESHWFPRFEDEMVSFSLRVELPAHWQAVSQGESRDYAENDSTPTLRWAESHPQNDIYLVAAPFHRYRRATPFAEALAYLRTPDRPLADVYLATTGKYLALYTRLLGPYPYKKFALVENFQQTGYGMPSFTLLGSRVIRLPFIPYTSYPHEILHNWWGNGVYVDYATGNWSEGLTAYLADHLLAEQAGRGAEYRRSTLQKYANFVSAGRDFPLRDFRARQGEASQAVGYGKALMFFHMLRRELGDETFIAGLRRFYAQNKFKPAGYGDIRRALEGTSGARLGTRFAQWIDRVGAPRLGLAQVSLTQEPSGYRVRGELRQVQRGSAYRLQVPVAVQLDNQEVAFETTLLMATKRLKFDIAVAGRPLRFAVDPQFDLFRRLDPRELPPSLGQLFGAEHATIVLPSAAPARLRDAYAGLARSWARWRKMSVVWDTSLPRLPTDRAVWVLGWENRFRAEIAHRLTNRLDAFSDRAVVIKGQVLRRDTDSVVLTTRRPDEPTVGWLGSPVEALPGLARKLPHYDRYGYLAFAGSGPANILKGEWQVFDSPLVVSLPGSTRPVPELKLAARPPLTAAIATQPP